MPKYLFYFEKAESVRWLGHLDILRAFERAVRRAGLPIAFTLGYNPRVRINFASALSTGVTGSAEPAVIELTDALEPSEIDERLNTVLPPGIRISGCSEIPEAGKRDLLNSFDKAEYTVTSDTVGEISEEAACGAVTALLAQTEISIEREREGRTRSINIRPMISELEFVSIQSENRRITWRAIVGIGEAGNVKAADIIAALAGILPGLKLRRAHRVRLISDDETVALASAL